MPETGTPILACRGVTVRFGGVTALDRVDFEAAPGRITAVIGPNGAGKTTLFNAVTGMVRAAEGRVLMSRKDITAMEPHKRGRAGIVRTFQNLEIFTNMSVLENVMTGGHRRVGYGLVDCLLRTPRFRREEARCRAEAMERLAFVGLADKADHPSGDLAFGLQRLLEIARAIAADPDLLLLDEPAAGLNMKETQQLGRLIQRIRDEAHRFAVSYHRGLRDKGTLYSQLEEIPGIGPRRRQALLKHFGSMRAIAEASIEDMKAVAGMNEKAAKAVRNFLDKESSRFTE